MTFPACVPCSERAPFFDGISSYGHAALGASAAMISSGGAALIALGFILYQMAETEQLSAKVGDFGEFASGYLGAQVLRLAGNHR